MLCRIAAFGLVALALAGCESSEDRCRRMGAEPGQQLVDCVHGEEKQQTIDNAVVMGGMAAMSLANRSRAAAPAPAYAPTPSYAPPPRPVYVPRQTVVIHHYVFTRRR